MVEMINRIEKRRPNDRIILKDLKTGATKTYEIPVGKRVIYGKQEFDMSKVPESQMEEDSDWEDPTTPFGPGIKPEPGDIVIPIPEEPLNFENPYKFDKENMDEDK